MKSKARIHHLKTIQPYFDDVVSGSKNFEVRKNDRDFKVGDILVLFECVDGNKTGKYTGQKITYILDNKDYCKEGYVVLGIEHELVFVDTADHIELALNEEIERISKSTVEDECIAGVLGEIYIKVDAETGIVVGATDKWSQAYAWFYEGEVSLDVWCDVAHFIIDTEELLDRYSQFGFWYALECSGTK